MRLPATMRAAVLYDVDRLAIEERPVPTLAAGEVLLRMDAAGICSGDLMPWYVRRKAPLVLGHELAGTIVAFGDGDAVGAGGDMRDAEGEPLVLGARVAAHHHAPCFACAACARGAYVQCATWRAGGFDPGGLAEYVRLPRGLLGDLLLLPATMSAEDGSLVEPLGCVLKSLRRASGHAVPMPMPPIPAMPSLSPLARATPPTIAEAAAPRSAPIAAIETLYVIGLGVMGLMHVAVARALGARVVASDFLADRRARALVLGAEGALEPEAAAAELHARFDEGPAVVVCGPGSAGALAHALETVRPDGTVVMFTPLDPNERFSFDQSSAYFRDLRIVASYSCGPEETRAARAWIHAGIITAERLGARRYPLEAAAEAYRAMRDGEIVKAVVSPSQSGTESSALIR